MKADPSGVRLDHAEHQRDDSSARLAADEEQDAPQQPNNVLDGPSDRAAAPAAAPRDPSSASAPNETLSLAAAAAASDAENNQDPCAETVHSDPSVAVAPVVPQKNDSPNQLIDLDASILSSTAPSFIDAKRSDPSTARNQDPSAEALQSDPSFAEARPHENVFRSERLNLDASVFKTTPSFIDGVSTSPPPQQHEQQKGKSVPDDSERDRKEKITMRQNAGPLYKDQARSVRTNNRGDRVDGVQDNERDLIRAQLVDGDQAHMTVQPLRGGIFLRRRTILLLVALALVAVAVVGGVCGGTDACRPSEQLVQSTESPTGAPLSPHEYIESIRISTHTLRIPPPSDGSTTPEELALQWLLEEDGVEELSQDRLKQRYALATIYYSTINASLWTNEQPEFPEDDYSDWLEAPHECDWTGVYCLGNTINALDLFEFDCDTVCSTQTGRACGSGSVPSDIGLLDTLFDLGIIFCSVKLGPLPTSIGTMTLLEYLVITGLTTGSLPETLGSLSKPREFDLDDGGFTGSLPSSIGQWTDLTYFAIENNAISGTLPASIGNWTTIQGFYVSSPSFTIMSLLYSV